MISQISLAGAERCAIGLLANTREILHSLKRVGIQSCFEFRVHPVSSIAERIEFGLIRSQAESPNQCSDILFPLSLTSPDVVALIYAYSILPVILTFFYLYESLFPHTSAMFLTVLIACLPVLASAAPLFPRSNLGNATYYAPNLPTGTCSFSTYTLPAGIFGSALSDSNWDNAAKCGACVSVTVSKGKSITAMVSLPL